MSLLGNNRSLRSGQDRFFWLFVALIFVAYAFLQAQSVLRIGLTLASLLIAITVHECSHAWTALKLGDNTAASRGRVSLNPLVHLDPLGTAMMVITTLTGLGIGWGKPVPVYPHRLRFGARLGNGIVAASGPVSNLVAAVVFAGLAQVLALFDLGIPWISLFLQYVVLINLVIALFNLLPLPPLDGHSVLIGLLSLFRGRWAYSLSNGLDSLNRFGPMLLFGLIIFTQFMGLNIIGRLVGEPAFALYRLIMGGPGLV